MKYIIFRLKDATEKVITLSQLFQFSTLYNVALRTFQNGLVQPGNTKGGSITVPLTSCLTGLD